MTAQILRCQVQRVWRGGFDGLLCQRQQTGPAVPGQRTDQQLEPVTVILRLTGVQSQWKGHTWSQIDRSQSGCSSVDAKKLEDLSNFDKNRNVMSKLKRRKTAVEERQSEKCSRGTQKKTLSAGDVTMSEAERSGDPAALWWNRDRPPAVEALWSLTLKSALSYLQNQHWDLVPDLPEPSTARSSALKEDDQMWCDLREEVPPFPEPPPKTLPGPGPVQPSFSQQNLPLQPKPGPDPADPQPSSHSGRSLNIKKTSLQVKRWPSVGEKERRGGELSDKWPLLNQPRIPDRAVFVEEGVTNKEEVKDREEEVRRSVGAAGGVLQSCPMCLLEFPVGSTQMDCDGHLAQCLSEVNADVTW
ncbi:uncharacterized protein LOC141798993 [Halichoeres trimaculatus]|uniref:uncharacterized protein LOC141798993 n=1 Tax=Halichoeres trimaculatus TaxID=147232 RepID=UPI003D9E94D2